MHNLAFRIMPVCSTTSKELSKDRVGAAEEALHRAKCRWIRSRDKKAMLAEMANLGEENQASKDQLEELRTQLEKVRDNQKESWNNRPNRQPGSAKSKP